MIKMIDVNERVKFVSATDNTEPKTEFTIRPLTAMEQGKAVLKHEANLQMEGMFGVVKYCLVEIKDGEKVIKEINDDVLNSIPLQVIMELYNFIMARNIIGAEERKN